MDVNPYNIKVCKIWLSQRGGDPGITFSVAESVAAEGSENYDAIFALAVFRHGDLSIDCQFSDPHIHFSDFERAATELARCLKPGGLFVIRHAHFRFSDTAISTAFHKILHLPSAGDAPFYGTDNRLLLHGQCDDGVFQKRADLECRINQPTGRSGG